MNWNPSAVEVVVLADEPASVVDKEEAESVVVAVAEVLIVIAGKLIDEIVAEESESVVDEIDEETEADVEAVSVTLERTAVAVPEGPITKNIVVVTVTVASAAAPVVVASLTLSLSVVALLEVEVLLVLATAELEVALTVVLVLLLVLVPVLVDEAETETEVETTLSLSVARIWRPRMAGIARRTAGVVVGTKENKFCTTEAEVIEVAVGSETSLAVMVKVAASTAPAALTDNSEAIDAMAADTAEVGNAPPAVTPGMLIMTVFESVLESPFELAFGAVAEAEALMIGAVADTMAPVPRGTDAAAEETAPVSSESSSVESESEQEESSSSPVATVELDVAVVVPLVVEVLFKPVPAPSIPPEAPASSILATAFASVSQANAVPLLLTSGSAKHERPCEQAVKVNVDPVH